MPPLERLEAYLALVAAVEAVLEPVVVRDPTLTDKMTPQARLQ
jgi:hypothetical protein